MPSRIRRRTLLAGLAAVPAAGLLGCDRSDRTAAGPISTVGTLTFANRLRIPPLTGGVLRDGIRTFTLTAAAGSAEFLPGLSTPTWAYSDGRFPATFLGPTLRARRGERVRVDVDNSLARDHCPLARHAPSRRSTAGRTRPSRPAAPGHPEWTVDQPAATLWYHPHPHGDTAGQVDPGLAGMFLVRDHDDAAGSPRAYGVDDIPVIMQDRLLEPMARSTRTSSPPTACSATRS